MKIDAGTSALTNPQHAQVSEGGMGLGEYYCLHLQEQLFLG